MAHTYKQLDIEERDAIKCYLETLLKEKSLDFSTGVKRREHVLVGI